MALTLKKAYLHILHETKSNHPYSILTEDASIENRDFSYLRTLGIDLSYKEVQCSNSSWQTSEDDNEKERVVCTELWFQRSSQPLGRA